MAAAASLVAARGAAASGWPDRPIRIVVPFAPGGNTDGIARLTAELLRDELGADVLVDNRTGAGGLIAAESVARAAPDGATLMMAVVAQLAVAPAAAAQRQRFDPVADFTPVAQVATNLFVLVAHRDLPVSTVEELIAHGRRPGAGLVYASGGVGSFQHLTMLLFLSRAGMEATHVPYRGGAPALADTVAGQTPLLFANLSEALPHVRSPSVRLLAVSGAARAPQLPDVPTVAESGLAGFETVTWNGLIGPARLPDAIVGRVASAVERRLADPAMRARFAALGVDAAPLGPAEFGWKLRRDVERWGEVVRTSGVRID